MHNINPKPCSFDSIMKLGGNGFIVLILCVICNAVQGQTIEQWQKYEDSLGRYSVLLPDTTLRSQVDTLMTDLGPLSYHTVFFHREEEKGVSLYKVSWCDYPEETVHADSAELLEDFFEATIESAVDVVQGELIYKQTAAMDKFTGWKWRIHYNKGDAVLHSSACLVGNRYFLLQSAAPRAYGLSPEIERFFSSWRYLR